MTWWPGWDSVASAGYWSHFWFWFGIFCLFALGASEVVSHMYGLRKDELVAVAESNAAAQRQNDADAAETRRKAEVEGLQKQLAEADKKAVAALKQQEQRLLPDSVKQELIAALSPFRGQKVTLLTVLGDAECKRFLEDFIGVFDAAGWDHGDKSRVLYGNFGNTQDPVGVAVLLSVTQFSESKMPKSAFPLVKALSSFVHVTVQPGDKIEPDTLGLVVGRKPPP